MKQANFLMCQFNVISKPLQGFITFALQKVGISRSVGAAAFWSMVESFSAPFFSLMLMPILTHNLGLANYGVYVMAMAFIALSGFTGFGMNTAITYHLAKNSAYQNVDYKKNIAQQLTSALAITLIGTVGFATLFLLSLYFSQGYLKINHPQWLTYSDLKIQVVLLLIFTQCDMVISAALKGLQHFKTSALCEFLIRLSGFSLLTGVAFYYKQVEIIISFAVLVSAVSLIIRLMVMRKTADLKINDMRYNKIEAKIFFSFGKWMTLQNMSGVIFSTVDKLILGAYYGPALAGVYNILVTFAQLIHFALSSALSFILPKVSKTNLPAKIIKKSYYKSLLISGCSTLVLALVLYSFYFYIQGHFKLSNLHSEYVLLLVSFSILAMNIPPYYFALGFGKVKTLSTINIFSGILGTVACLVLIPIYGILGACIARIFYAGAVCITFVIMSAIFKNKSHELIK